MGQTDRQTANRKPDTVPGGDNTSKVPKVFAEFSGMVLGYRGGGGERRVRTVCLGGDSGLEPAGGKGASPQVTWVKYFFRLGVAAEALGQGGHCAG